MSDSPSSMPVDAEGSANLHSASRRSLCSGGFRSRRHGRWAALACRLLPMLLLPVAAFADTFPIGFIAWDVTDPDVAGQFDIVNQTGPNSSGDATWPVTTALALSSLALTVHFTDSTTSLFGASYFTLSADGLSFDGDPIPIDGGSPQPTEATLTGSLNPLGMTLFDGSALDVLPTFTASIPFRAGGLSDGDLQIIAATSVVTAVPEPTTATLLTTFMIAFLGMRHWKHLARRLRFLMFGMSGIGRHSQKTKWTFGGPKTAQGMRLMPLALALLLSTAPASAAVKLNLWTAPDSGVAGTSFVNLAGSGFPTTNGTISPGDVNVSLSLACGGPVLAATTASSVKRVIGSSYRVQFELPASLLTGNYFASISGMTADRTPFLSSNCSEVTVTASSESGLLIGRSWTAPAESESYRCRAIQLLTDLYITGFHPVLSPGDYRMVLTVSDTPFTSMGDYNCNAGSGLDLGEKGFYGAGLGTNDLSLPPGVAVHLKAGQFINMNLHVVNFTATDVTEFAGVEVQTTSAANVTNEAEMIFGGTFNISMPPDGMPHPASGGCSLAAPQDTHVFALWPHMHGIGTRIKLVQTHTMVPQTVLDVPYTDESQLVYPLAPAVLMQQGDFLSVTCTYVNNTGHTVTFGESATDEECFLGIYRYPVIPGDSVFACVN